MNRKIFTILAKILLIISALAALFPFVYMLLTSLRKVYSLELVFSLKNINLNNYETIFKNFEFLKYFKNSTVVVVGSCLFNGIIASLAGYGFAKKKFPGRDIIFWGYIATLMIPGQVRLIPVFIIMRKLNILNTYAGLIIPILNAFGVFLIRQFMLGVPDELIEAANMDGCGELKTFYTIVIPLVKPVLISLTIFTFITTWNNFIWPLVIATESSKATLTLALSTLRGNYSTNYGLVMAGATLCFLPPFILYIFLQKQFIEGIALSGVKG